MEKEEEDEGKQLLSSEADARPRRYPDNADTQLGRLYPVSFPGVSMYVSDVIRVELFSLPCRELCSPRSGETRLGQLDLPAARVLSALHVSPQEPYRGTSCRLGGVAG